MKLKPLGKNVLARKLEDTKTTASGIVLPDTVGQQDVVMLEVVAVGGEVDMLVLKPGDHALARRQYLEKVDLGDGAETYSLEVDDILATVVPEEA